MEEYEEMKAAVLELYYRTIAYERNKDVVFFEVCDHCVAPFCVLEGTLILMFLGVSNSLGRWKRRDMRPHLRSLSERKGRHNVNQGFVMIEWVMEKDFCDNGR